MKTMVVEYKKSCEKLTKRIKELAKLRMNLIRQGDIEKVEELDLDRRIELLYVEQRQTREVIVYLLSYIRRVEERGEKAESV